MSSHKPVVVYLVYTDRIHGIIGAANVLPYLIPYRHITTSGMDKRIFPGLNYVPALCTNNGKSANKEFIYQLLISSSG
ncbi:MAG: hypothetical protein WA364_13335 [Candidatus Nitrosopolaris sp.]